MNLKASKNIKVILQELVQIFQSILKDNLVGIYLHGSLAMGCFNPKSSDVDFLVIVKRKLSVEKKRKIIRAILILYQADRIASKGLEFSVILKKYLDHFIYPTPFELHFSNDWRKKYENDQVDYSKENKDYDLAAHFVITRIYGLCLFGEPIASVFSDIPEEYYLNSIVRDSEWGVQNILKGPDKGECRVPVYAVLNFCRVLAFIDQGRVTSKAEGGQWGLKSMPKQYRPVIREAFHEYRKSGAGKLVNAKLLKEFGRYVQIKLPNESRKSG